MCSVQWDKGGWVGVVTMEWEMQRYSIGIYSRLMHK